MMMMMMNNSWFLCLCASLAVDATTLSRQPDSIVPEQALPQQRRRKLDFVPGHLQSGPDSQGSTFASSSVVDRNTNTLHVIGTTYGNWWNAGKSGASPSSGTDDPACFYAMANIPGGDDQHSMDWIHSELLGSPTVNENCLGMLVDFADKRAIVLGHTDIRDPDTDEAIGLLAPFFDAGNIQATGLRRAGMVLDYKFTDAKGPTNESPLQIQGGYLNERSSVNYPVAVAGILPSPDVIYSVSMHSFSSEANIEWENGEQVDPATFFQLGRSYVMSIERYSTSGTAFVGDGDQQLQRSIQSTVEETYGASASADEGVRVTALLQLPDRLLVAGYTRGYGDGFGGADLADVPLGNTFDGFVTQFGLNDLQPITQNRVPTHRVTSKRDDYVKGLCWSDKTPQHVYVAGSSTGHVKDPLLNTDNDNGNMWGFLQKVKLDDMSVVWTQEFEAAPENPSNNFSVEAVSCAVTPDGQNVFVAGNVYMKASMVGPSSTATSAGGVDVWIAQLQTQSNDGNVVFLEQLGSEKDDFVANRGGVQSDKFGNAVLVGNTGGDIYRSRGSAEGTGANSRTDVFLAMFELNSGKFTVPMDHPDFKSLPPKVTKAPTPAPPPGGAPAPAPKEDNDKSSSIKEKIRPSGESWVNMLVILVIAIVAVIAGIFYWNCYHIPKRDVATDRTKVLAYLHDFDVEDVELKHSATGGWHCSYTNDLARGVNHQGRSLEHGGNDSLYMQHFGSSGSAYDPLTAGGGRSLHRRNSGSSSRSGGRGVMRTGDLLDDFHNADAPVADDFVVTFGTARESRRERRANYEGLLNSMNKDSNSSRRGRRTASSNSSVSSASSAGSSRRINRARERWENREII